MEWGDMYKRGADLRYTTPQQTDSSNGNTLGTKRYILSIESIDRLNQSTQINFIQKFERI
uniref:Uncharacterized protein n=1 Tax=viral metagenome TaxID=1070528 RepID=A0A6C0EJ84_9ZZZZ